MTNPSQIELIRNDAGRSPRPLDAVVSLHGDCLSLLPSLASESIDLILCDLPYGTTACKWDTVIPFEPLWREYKRIIRKDGAIVLNASQPFTSALVMSNIEMFRYEWIWEKDRPTNIYFKDIQPMKYHENILVFSKSGAHNMSKEKMRYNPQMEIKPEENKRKNRERIFKNNGVFGDRTFIYKSKRGEQDNIYPKSVQFFNRQQNGEHPTQKPIPLLEYLIKTYTNENDLVLDNAMGSGTTGVACVNTKRRFIGMEKEEKYFLIASKCISDALNAVTN
jgi:site-specific DNA-methyltransferase (adenine-specific)